MRYDQKSQGKYALKVLTEHLQLVFDRNGFYEAPMDEQRMFACDPS
jgi:hypothetical protein